MTACATLVRRAPTAAPARDALQASTRTKQASPSALPAPWARTLRHWAHRLNPPAYHARHCLPAVTVRLLQPRRLDHSVRRVITVQAELLTSRPARRASTLRPWAPRWPALARIARRENSLMQGPLIAQGVERESFLPRGALNLKQRAQRVRKTHSRRHLERDHQIPAPHAPPGKQHHLAVLRTQTASHLR